MITIKGEIYHILTAPNDTCRVNCCDYITLSQFASNSSNYLTNNTTLIFTPGSHTIEVEVSIKYVHSFAMLAETNPLTPTEIVCYNHANFIFNNVSIVTVIGFKFSGCIGNQILSVSQFHLKKSMFYGQVQVNDCICGTVLTMAKTVSCLERISFKLHYNYIEQLQNYTLSRPMRFMDTCPGVILHADASIVAIKESIFAGNHWKLLHSKSGSNISISSTTFSSNKANHGGILYATSQSTMNLTACVFKKCKGELIEAVDAAVTITHSLFFNTLRVLTNSRNNNSQLLNTSNTKLSVRHSEFIGNENNLILFLRGGDISIHHCQFIRTVASTILCLIQYAESLSITHNEFRNNNVIYGIVYIYDNTGMTVTANNDFINNNALFSIFISSDCKLGLSLSPDSSRCIPCPEYWRGNLAGVVIATIIAGLVLVMLSLFSI